LSENKSLDSKACQISTQILQCKAILCGLDVSLQRTRCSAQQREKLQPEVILALKASVQVATHSLFVTFATFAGLEDNSFPDSNDLSTPGTTRQPSPFGFSRDEVATATNVTLNLQNSARMISLPGHHVTATDGFLPQRNQHSRPSGASYGSRAASVPLSVSSDWQSPFSLPDPLAFDDSRACTILTDRHARPTIVVPKIVVDTCEALEVDNMPASIITVDENLPLGVNLPTLPRSSAHALEQSYQVVSETPCAPRTNDDPTCTMYVPHRPWYKPLGRADSRVDLISVKESVNGRYEADSTVMVEAASSPEPATKTDAEQSYPPMPQRSPPPPPSPSVARSKRKPPVPPRRRVYLIGDSTDPAKQSCRVKRAPQSSAPLMTCVDAPLGDGAIPATPALPYLDQLKHVLELDPAPQRRASTGEIHLGAHPNKLDTDRTKLNLCVQRNETLDLPNSPRSEVRRSRSASAPEITTSN
jgi:hypothetical protein